MSRKPPKMPFMPKGKPMGKKPASKPQGKTCPNCGKPMMGGKCAKCGGMK